jgi:hypothetical protein
VAGGGDWRSPAAVSSAVMLHRLSPLRMAPSAVAPSDGRWSTFSTGDDALTVAADGDTSAREWVCTDGAPPAQAVAVVMPTEYSNDTPSGEGEPGARAEQVITNVASLECDGDDGPWVTMDVGGVVSYVQRHTEEFTNSLPTTSLAVSFSTCTRQHRELLTAPSHARPARVIHSPEHGRRRLAAPDLSSEEAPGVRGRKDCHWTATPPSELW